MFSNYTESTNDQNPFFIGTVVDNKDPTNNYRVKVRLPKIHKNIKDDDLPWAARVDRAFRGIKSDTPKEDGAAETENESSASNKGQAKNNEKDEKKSKKKNPPNFDHCVPEKGTKVLVLAIQNDVNALVYLGALYKKTDLTPTEEKKYLETYGIYGEKDQFIGIDATNEKDNEIKVHFIGHVDVDKVKKVTVNAKDDIKVMTKKNITIEIVEGGGSDGEEEEDSDEENGDGEEKELNITILNKKGNVKVECKNLEAVVEEKTTLKCKDLNAEVEKSTKLKCESLNAEATKEATIKSKKIKLDGDVEITGDLKIKGDTKAEGEINSGDIPLTQHVHAYTWTDDGGSSVTTPSQTK